MTERTTIVNSVNTSNDSSQKRRVSQSVVTRIDIYCSEQGDMTELTPRLNSVYTYNDSLQRRRVALRVVSSIESDCSEHGDKTESSLILNNFRTGVILVFFWILKRGGPVTY
jgi:hypothetical protein